MPSMTFILKVYHDSDCSTLDFEKLVPDLIKEVNDDTDGYRENVYRFPPSERFFPAAIFCVQINTKTLNQWKP